MPALGCAATQVRVQPRGGSGLGVSLSDNTVGGVQNVWSSVEWARALDGFSGCQVRLEGRARCDEWASKVEPWRDEIAVYSGNVRVWCGPVTEVTFVGDELRIDGKDLMYWMFVRKIHHDLFFGQGTDLADIWNAVVESALSIDTSPNFTAVATHTGVLVDEPEGRRYFAGQNIYAMDILNELSRTAIDWTVIDRTVIVGGGQVSQVVNPTLTTKMFAEHPEIVKSGYDFGTRFTVSGTGRGDAADAHSATNDPVSSLEDTYGVVERTFSESFVRDIASAKHSANSRFDLFGRGGVPRFINGGKLLPTAPLDIMSLIPGRVFKLSSMGLPNESGVYRLGSVNASVGPEHDWISIGLEPLGEVA